MLNKHKIVYLWHNNVTLFWCFSVPCFSRKQPSLGSLYLISNLMHSERCQYYRTNTGMPHFKLAQDNIVALFKICQHQQQGVRRTGLFRLLLWSTYVFFCRSGYIRALTRGCMCRSFQMLCPLSSIFHSIIV